MRVLLAGGGTAGHTSPLLATADALRRLEPGVEITCLGTPRGLENRVVPEAGYPLELISPVPLPRRPGVDLLKVPVRLRGAVREATRVLDRTGAEVVVGFGGYVSMPAYLAARRRRVPIVLHEQNAVPGLANKAGARIARRVAVSFPDTPLPRAEYVGLPLRAMIARLDREATSSRGPAVLRPRPRPADPAGHRRLAGSAAAQPGGLRRLGGAGGCGCAGAPRGRPEGRGTATSRGCAQRRALRRAAVRRPDGPRLRRRRPGAVALRRQQRRGGRGGRAPRDLRAAADRQRRAGAQRAPGGRGRGSAAREGRRPHLGVGGEPGADRWPPIPPRLAAMAAAASGLVPRDADERLARIVLEVGPAREDPGPRRAAARRRARPGALRRHRRRGALGHRADHGLARPARHRQRRQRHAVPAPGCASSA